MAGEQCSGGMVVGVLVAAALTEALFGRSNQLSGMPTAMMVQGNRAMFAVEVGDVALWCRDDVGSAEAPALSCWEGRNDAWDQISDERSTAAGTPVQPLGAVSFNRGTWLAVWEVPGRLT